MIPWLDKADAFPPLDFALQEPNGLLCAGGDLSPARLVDAYQRGIFPWYSAGEPILWWSPSPRMVLVPEEFRCSRSLRRSLRRGGYEVRFDQCFETVIEACARTPRSGQNGTWITKEMRNAYSQLFALGYAHCVETWVDGKLLGGLYGLAIGRMFYGESMFSLAQDASKIAMAHLTSYLEREGFGLIDCQMNTPHLASLGAREIDRSHFIRRLEDLTAIDVARGRWQVDAGDFKW